MSFARWSSTRSSWRRSTRSCSAIGGLKDRIFLESFIRKAAHGQQNLRLTSKEEYGHEDFQLTTPTDFLAGHPTQQTIAPAASSWGENGYLGVWLDETNSWIYPHLHSAARANDEMARAHLPMTTRRRTAC